MKQFILLVLDLFMIAVPTVTEKCVPPAQQGNPYKLRFANDPGIPKFSRIAWNLFIRENKTHSTVLSLCYKGSNCQDTQPSIYTGVLTENENSVNASTLTILSVDRNMDGNGYQWYIDTEMNGVCNLQVYDYRSTPRCSNPRLERAQAGDSLETRMTVECDISTVFPQADCQFSQTIIGKETESVVPSLYTQKGDTTYVQTENVYYSRTCKMSRPVNDLLPEAYSFQVSFYPMGFDDGEKYGKDVVSVFDLSVPKPICSSPLQIDHSIALQCVVASPFSSLTCDLFMAMGELTNPRTLINSTVTSCTHGLIQDNMDCFHVCILTVPLSFKSYNNVLWFQMAIGNTDGEWSGPFMLTAPTPTCQEPEQNLESVTLTCNASSILSTSQCTFLWLTSEGRETSIDDQYTSLNFTPTCENNLNDLCVQQCKLDIPLSVLGAGRHRFRVSNDVSKSNWTSDIHLFYPAARLDLCPNGFIREGQTETCGCIMLDQGNPTGRVRWVLPNNTEVGTVTDEANTLLYLTYDPKGNNPEYYQCEGISSLGQGDIGSVTYVPRFAYGPKEVTEFIVPPVLSACQLPYISNVTATCNFDIATVNPEPNVVLIVPGYLAFSAKTQIHQAGRYSYRFDLRPLANVTAGSIKVECVAVSSAFTGMKKTASREIVMHQPPDSPPVVLVDGQSFSYDEQVINVTEGQTVKVECVVQGGSPLVSLISIQCGSQRTTAPHPQALLFMVMHRSNNMDTCVCSAEHSSGCYNQTKSVSFNMLYGPDSVQLSTNTSYTTQCPSKPETFAINCEVPTEAANPRPRVVLEGFGHIFEPYHETHLSGTYTSHFLVTPDAGGLFSITCRASNPMISSLQAVHSTKVTVVAPPSSAPSISIKRRSHDSVVVQNGHQVNVTEGEAFEILCDVMDGFPAVDTVLMACAGHTFQAEGSRLAKSLTLSKTLVDNTCSCRAVHSSNCYNLTSAFTFNVQYPAQITNFTIQVPSYQLILEDESHLVVDEGTHIVLECEAEGKPRPDLQIKGRMNSVPGQSSISLGNHITKTVASKTMTCTDTAFYVCEASNGIGESDIKSILVSVLCSPELAESDSDSTRTLEPSIGSDLKMKIRIACHPMPQEFSLIKDSTRSKRSTHVHAIGSQRYHAESTIIDELYGEVTLTMFSVTDTDNGQYELIMKNGVGEGLSYPFNVQIDEGDEEDTSTESNNLGPIVGGVIAAAVAVGVVVAITCYVIKSRRKTDHEAGSHSRETVYDNDEKPDAKTSVESKSRDLPLHYVRADKVRSTKCVSEDVTDYAEINDFADDGDYLHPDDITKQGKEDDGQPGNEYNRSLASVGPSDEYRTLEDDQYVAPDPLYQRIIRQPGDTPISGHLNAASVDEALSEQ